MNEPSHRTTETEMPAATLEALRGSIAKWEAIVAGTGTDMGPDNCPLCLKFHFAHRDDEEDGCSGCPVYARTGEVNCGGSPYDDYTEAEESDDDDSEERMHAAAKAELAFLKSLLPKEAR